MTTAPSANDIVYCQTSGCFSIEARFEPLNTWSLAGDGAVLPAGPDCDFPVFRLPRYRTSATVAACALLLVSSWMAAALIEDQASSAF